MSYRCYLGLGGNLTNALGSPSEHIHNAVERLKAHPSINNVRPSSLYASKPMGPQDQPDFVNAVVELETDLSAHELLDVCQKLENQARRERKRHWGERSLDVDILLYGSQQIKTTDLTVPHAGIYERNFVLIPLLELNPELKILDTPLTTIPMSADWTGLTRIGLTDLNLS